MEAKRQRPASRNRGGTVGQVVTATWSFLSPLWLLLTVLILASCHAAEYPGELQVDSLLSHDGLGVASHEVDLVVLNREPALGEPADIHYTGDRLWVTDRAGDPYLHLLDNQSGRILRSVVRRGQGPGELQDISVASVAGEFAQRDSSAIWLYDWRSLRLTRITENSFIQSTSAAPIIVSTGEYGSNADRWPYALDSTRFVVLERSVSPRLQILDREGRAQLEVPFRLPGADSIEQHQREMSASGSGICVMLDGSGFALFTRAAGRIGLYDSHLALQVLASVPYPSEELFEFSTETAAIEFTPKRNNYLKCSFSRDALFALFSGEVPSDPNRRVDARFVHVFSLSGHFLAVLRLSHSIHSLTVSPDGRMLFGLSKDSATVYRGRIPTFER